MRKSYPKYKPTVIAWASKIPEHWKLIRAKHIFKVVDDKTAKGDEELLSVSEHHGVIPRKYANVNTFKAESYEGYKLCKKRDLVINSLWAWSCGLGVSEYEGIVSNAYSVYRLKIDANHRFFNYLLRTKGYVGQYFIRSKGIWISRLQLSDLQFLDIPIVLPPKEEQISISNYLDIKTEQINNFIAKKETLIANLKSQKQAIINEHITKGINDGVDFKDSGVLWLGKIPSHWQVWKLSHIAKTLSGSTPESSKINEYYDGSINWVRSTDLNDDELFDLPIKITEKGLIESACKIIPKNSVLIAMYGGDGTIGKNAILRIESALNQAVCAIVPSKKINSEFLFYYSKFLRPIWMLYANGARKDPNISQDIIKQIKIVLPPLDEQLDIVKLIKEKIAQIDIVISRVEKEIEKVKELKQSLIAEVVTGKIKIL